MADIVFKKKTGQLECLGTFGAGKKRKWSVASGIPGKYASLSNKLYTVPPKSLMVGTKHVAGVPFDKKYAAASFKDKKGFGWFLWLGEGDLGIHPDGNVPGTKGCIGITDSDTQEFFDILKGAINRQLVVKVTN